MSYVGKVGELVLPRTSCYWMRFEVLTVTSMNVAVSWDVAQCIRYWPTFQTRQLSSWYFYLKALNNLLKSLILNSEEGRRVVTLCGLKLDISCLASGCWYEFLCLIMKVCFVFMNKQCMFGGFGRNPPPSNQALSCGQKTKIFRRLRIVAGRV
jgi:hypothetical protein